MFEFIEEPMTKAEDTPPVEVVPPLEGTVYTMPSHFKANTSHSSKTPGWVFAIVVLVVLAVLGTGGFFVWKMYYPNLFTSLYSQFTQLIQPKQQQVADTAPKTATTNEAPVVTEPVNGINDVQPIAGNDNVQTLPTCGPNEKPETSKCTAVPPNPDASAVLPYVKSLDTDNDGLTDVEEKMFGTDSSKPDTDGDGYIDGAEVQALYNPLNTTGKLEGSDLVIRYTNPLFHYALLYPSLWVVSAVDTTKREVLFSSSTGEFVSLKVQDNPEKLSALDWYTTMEKVTTDTKSLQTMTYDTWSGVMSADQLQVYITAKDDKGAVITPYVYVLKYDLGAKKEINFSTTFQMMIRSFLITDLSFQK